MGKILKLVWFTTKVGLAAGSVYVTVDQRVWGTPEESSKLYDKLNENIPGLKSFKEEFGDLMPKIPANLNFRDSWNSGVLKTFSFIADSPAKACQLTDYIVQWGSSMLEQQQQQQAPTEQKET